MQLTARERAPIAHPSPMPISTTAMMHRVILLAAVMMRFAVRTASVGIDFGFMSRPTTDEIAAKILEVDGVTEGSRQYGHPGIRIVYRFEDKWFTVTWNEKKTYLRIAGRRHPACCLTEANRLQTLLGGRVREREDSDEPEVTPGGASSHESPAAATTQQTTVPAATTDAGRTPTTRTPAPATGPRPTGSTAIQEATTGTIRSTTAVVFSGPPAQNSNSFNTDEHDVVTDDGMLVAATADRIQRARNTRDALDWIQQLNDPEELRAIAMQGMRVTADLEEEILYLTRRINEMEARQP